jgi:hypothetical protein
VQAHIQVERIYQHKFGNENGGALVIDSLPAVVTQVGDLEHRRIDISSSS